MMIHPTIHDELNEIRERLTADGTLLPPQKLQGYCDTFRRAFGPEVPRALNGVDLLNKCHRALKVYQE
ncbi:MAG: hypothetical protein ACRENP_24330 [Longimicrobiales bacterium]